MSITVTTNNSPFCNDNKLINDLKGTNFKLLLQINIFGLVFLELFK